MCLEVLGWCVQIPSGMLLGSIDGSVNSAGYSAAVSLAANLSQWPIVVLQQENSLWPPKCFPIDHHNWWHGLRVNFVGWTKFRDRDTYAHVQKRRTNYFGICTVYVHNMPLLVISTVVSIGDLFKVECLHFISHIYIIVYSCFSNIFKNVLQD